MKLLLKRIFQFALVLVIICALSLFLRFGIQGFEVKKYWMPTTAIFIPKIQLYESFQDRHHKVNLILGSSLATYGIVPDSLSPSWFSFGSPLQSLGNSLEFLEAKADPNKIDSLLIVINPWDFTDELISQKKTMQLYNPEFFLISPNIKNSVYLWEHIGNASQAFINNIFYKIWDIGILLKNQELKVSFPNNTYPDHVLTQSGFEILELEARNLDSLYSIKPERWVHSYYDQIRNPINTEAFDNMNSYCANHQIKLFYVLSPVSKIHLDEIYNLGYEKKRNLFINHVKNSGVHFQDMSGVLLNDNSDKNFRDSSHLSFQGAIKFTALLKEWLRH